MATSLSKSVVIITPGVAPVPAVKGGAVENLTQILLEKNEKDQKFQFTVVSIEDTQARALASKFKNTNFTYIPSKGTRYCTAKYIRAIANRICNKLYLGNQFISEAIKTLKNIPKPDAIIIENAPLFAIPLRRAFPSAKIIQHLHNRYIFPGSDRSTEIARATDHFFAVSNFIGDQISLGCAPSTPKVSTLYNGLATSRFQDKNAFDENIKMRTRLKINPNDFVFIYTGRMTKNKGLFELLEAFSKLKTNVTCKLLLIGRGGVAKQPLPKEVIVIGEVSHEEIHSYYNMADCAVLPSLVEEAFGLTILEAMLSGLPIITTDAGAIPEIVGNAAIIIQRGDNLPARLRNAMENLTKSPDLRAKLSSAALIRGLEFSDDRYWARFNELINQELSQ